MKKIFLVKVVLIFMIFILNINIFCGCSNANLNANKNSGIRTLNYEEVKNSLIRFHVIANSDSDEDQKLKIKVKDAVIEYLYPYLNDSKSLSESRQIIEDNMDKTKEIAERIIKDNNFNESVKVQLSRENFPDKSYGNIVLPQGNYEAFRIIIGDGQGKNWWCVMFPPLCFVDESNAEVEYDKVEENINKSNKEDNSNENIQNNNDDVKIKFKCIEIFKKMFNQGEV